MDLDVKLRLNSKEEGWLCFKHAVELALQGTAIETSIDQFDDYWMGPSYCTVCARGPCIAAKKS